LALEVVNAMSVVVNPAGGAESATTGRGRPRARSRRRESPWRFGGLSPRELAGRVWQEIVSDEVTDRAAALSYYFVLSLFPSLLFLTAMLGFLPLGGLQERLLTYIHDVLPPDAARTVSRTLREVLESNRGGLLSLGALLALWAGSNGMASVIAALNVAYDVAEWRPWWKRRLLAVVLTAAFSVYIIATLTLVVFGPRIAGMLAAWLGLGREFAVAWNVVALPLVILCGLMGITLVYHLAPAVRMRWSVVTPGAVIAVGLWLAVSYGLRLYVQYFANYSLTYGSIGGLILLLVWLYLTALVLLLGAEVDAEIEKAAQEEAPRRLPRAA
jgi:membrane protein